MTKHCDCGAHNHPSAIEGEYVHSESCPLYEDTATEFFDPGGVPMGIQIVHFPAHAAEIRNPLGTAAEIKEYFVKQDLAAGRLDDELKIGNNVKRYAHPSGIECIEVTRLCSFDMGNAIKYIWRHPDKDGAKDLFKAREYLQDVVATGQPHHLPWRAKGKLGDVIVAETNPVRRELFTLIRCGDLNCAIRRIGELITAV